MQLFRNRIFESRKFLVDKKSKFIIIATHGTNWQFERDLRSISLMRVKIQDEF